MSSFAKTRWNQEISICPSPHHLCERIFFHKFSKKSDCRSPRSDPCFAWLLGEKNQVFDMAITISGRSSLVRGEEVKGKRNLCRRWERNASLGLWRMQYLSLPLPPPAASPNVLYGTPAPAQMASLSPFSIRLPSSTRFGSAPSSHLTALCAWLLCWVQLAPP